MVQPWSLPGLSGHSLGGAAIPRVVEHRSRGGAESGGGTALGMEYEPERRAARGVGRLIAEMGRSTSGIPQVTAAVTVP